MVSKGAPMLNDLGSGPLNTSAKSILSEASCRLPAIVKASSNNPRPVKRKRKTRTVRKQIDELPIEERNAFFSLRVRWVGTVGNNPRLPDELLLRYARHHKFDERETWDALRKVQKSHVQRLLTLDIGSVEEQLRSRTLFPLPGMRTREGDEVFYMKPSRYNPKETPTQYVIDSLGYVMNCMVQKESNTGIALLANMNDWTLDHFSTEYFRKFMEMLQGHVIPSRVNLFLIVNPPQWFGKVWRIIKPMLAPEFQKKVHTIPESELFVHLQFNYEKYLPDEMESGKAPSGKLVEDFIEHRLLAEKAKSPRDTFGTQPSESTLGSSDETTQLDVTPGCYCGLFKRFGRSGRKRRCTPTTIPSL